MRVGVFTGSSLGTLQRVSSVRTFEGEVAFDAQAGHTYYIGAGCDSPIYCYAPQSFEVRPS
jgi:hypothetical protein